MTETYKTDAFCHVDAMGARARSASSAVQHLLRVLALPRGPTEHIRQKRTNTSAQPNWREQLCAQVRA